jgi:hypothetical protein
MSRLKQLVERARSQQDPTPIAAEEQAPPHTPEEIALWWAKRYNWPRVAQTLNITEEEAIRTWGVRVGWRELQEKIAKLNEQAKTLCQE